MALHYIDSPSDDDNAAMPAVRSDGERRFRQNYKRDTGSLKGADKAYRQSLVNRTTREIFGLTKPGSGPVTQRIAAPTAAELNDALKTEVTPVERIADQDQSRPTQYAQPDEGFYQSGPVSIGLSIY